MKIDHNPRARKLRHALLCAIMPTMLVSLCTGQGDEAQRKFLQPKARVEKALKVLESSMSGRLPVVEGFVQAGEHPFSAYRRAYYQSTVQVDAAAGGSVVRVSTKVTAWFADPNPARSGYKVLASNGRLESDLLDQLADQLGEPEGSSSPAIPPPGKAAGLSTKADLERKAPSADKKTPDRGAFSSSSSLTQSLAVREGSLPRPSSAKIKIEDADSETLRAEAASLEEVLKNQAHPSNIVSVKKSGTPVVDGPSLKAKPLFLASIHDEFEMLDFTPDWVHVRVSGLSRGWIWRNSLELPGSLTQGEAEGGPAAGSDVFHVSKEETAPFPGDWGPLRGKEVKIISIEKADDSAKDIELPVKLSFAKYLLQKSFDELAAKPGEVAGVVLIFDSADGGMIAATLASLGQWKAGKLSDAALWHQCFFDPPEAFAAQPGGE
jgi:CBS domain-containing protein